MSALLWESECEGKENFETKTVSCLPGKVNPGNFSDIRFRCIYFTHSAKVIKEESHGFLVQWGMLKI
jgi:hypothetical protein